jgi:hypothetical protein
MGHSLIAVQVFPSSTQGVAQKVMPHVFFHSKYLLKNTENNTYIQVRRFVSKLYLSTESPSTSTALRQREISACMPLVPFVVLLM